MDSRSFDRLARLLGEATDRRAGLKALAGGLLGGGGAAAVMDAEAKRRGKRKGTDRPADEPESEKRRKRCKPACTDGFVCERVGKKRACVCPTGVTCGEACCLVGQVCQGAACVPEPGPATCIAFGDPCKNAARRCCAGLTCASGQDGSYPVACYRSKGAACESTAECTFGMRCANGVCLGDGGGGGGDQCAPAGESCGGSTECCPGSTCNDGTCRSGGDDCPFPGTNLAYGSECCQGSQCATGLCWYPQNDDGDPVGTQKLCVLALDASCDYDTLGYSQCALGNECSDYPEYTGAYICTDYGDPEYYGPKVPTGATGCGDTVPCFSSSDYCNAGTCTPRTQRQIKAPCDPATDICPADATCTTYPVGSGATDTVTTYCLGSPFTYLASSAIAVDECASFRIFDAGNGNRCTNICAVYLTSGTADTDAARGVALKNALESGASGPFRFFYVEPDATNTKTYETQQITLNFPANGGMNMQACYGGPQGLRYTVSGNDANRILDITTAGAVLISDGIFEKGKATTAGSDTGNGGAIRIDSTAVASPLTSLSLADCTIRNSVAGGMGGGVASKGKFTLSGGVTIAGCTAGGEGGGWYAETGADQAATMANSVSITGNAASATAQGAGVYWEGTQFRQSSGPSDPGAGMQCAVGSGTKSITGNTGATYDCAYGATAATWAFCTCGTKET